MSIELKYLVGNVADMATAVAFWRDTVGLKLKFQSPEWAEFETGATRLALQPADARHAAGTWQPGLRVPDIYATRAALATKGVDVGATPQEEHGFLLSQFIDPDGAAISLSGPKPK